MEVEVASWDDEHVDFVKALASLEAASIVAGVPRLFVTRYIQALIAAREARLVTHDDDNSEWMTNVYVELRYVSQALWHPWVARLKARLPILPRDVEPTGRR